MYSAQVDSWKAFKCLTQSNPVLELLTNHGHLTLAQDNSCLALYMCRWGEAQLLPGALRLVRHLAKHNIQLAIATSTPRDTFNRKMANNPELRHLLRFVVGDARGLSGALLGRYSWCFPTQVPVV
jgi:phosphoglycolate phosphatase-like HAD superfamily hydrolase